MSDDAVLHDADRFRERTKKAREVSHMSKGSGTKQPLMALAENFELLAELVSNEMHATPSQTGVPNTPRIQARS